jgi:oligoendopeptidase F
LLLINTNALLLSSGAFCIVTKKEKMIYTLMNNIGQIHLIFVLFIK